MDNKRTYYAYSWHSTRQKAEDNLENYFAEGIVSEGERPRIRFERGMYGVEFSE